MYRFAKPWCLGCPAFAASNAITTFRSPLRTAWVKTLADDLDSCLPQEKTLLMNDPDGEGKEGTVRAMMMMMMMMMTMTMTMIRHTGVVCWVQCAPGVGKLVQRNQKLTFLCQTIWFWIISLCSLSNSRAGHWSPRNVLTTVSFDMQTSWCLLGWKSAEKWTVVQNCLGYCSGHMLQTMPTNFRSTVSHISAYFSKVHESLPCIPHSSIRCLQVNGGGKLRDVLAIQIAEGTWIRWVRSRCGSSD